MEDLYVFHIVSAQHTHHPIHFSGFRKVLRKQEVYGGTFPIELICLPLKTNLT